jgi:hypothetical protein
MQKNFPPRKEPSQESNWPFLAIAVAMAIVLWLFVRTGAQPLGQRTVSLPISVVHGAWRLGVAPERVEVRLEGTGVLMDRLSPDEVAAVADLSGHREGDLVRLTVVPPQGFRILSTSVTRVRVVEEDPAPPAGK